MIPARPSRTALGVARRRAAHQLLDRPLVLNDPLALRIIGDEERRLLESSVGRRFPPAPDDHPAARLLRAFVVARSRCAEEVLSASGVDQYVVLGAGLDTFAYRNPLAGVRVFEVDYPATQAWKLDALAAASIAIPGGSGGVTFVPVDFDRQDLATELARAGFDPDRPAVFAWLGVTMYLAEASVWNVLRYVLGRPAGSSIVFDYAREPSSLNPLERVALARMTARVARAGEPWTAYFEPGALDRGVRALGAWLVMDLDGAAINARWFAGRSDGLHVGGIGRLMVAST
ncbi:MAG TPA: class I SAM-dependent methyltransferase [Candidatus Limnocylindrales bacterium]|nr:class I SAM-dependent methyltransferase [Candidatus Limnocylindrales bacterium]